MSVVLSKFHLSCLVCGGEVVGERLGEEESEGGEQASGHLSSTLSWLTPRDAFALLLLRGWLPVAR
jgi:hypothetical protein